MTPTLDEVLVPAPKVWKRYGKTDRTLDRWLNDETLNFPKPIYIKNRRYFHEADLVEWERAQAGRAKAA